MPVTVMAQALRQDSYEFAQVTSNSYWDWYLNHLFFLVEGQSNVYEHLQTYLIILPGKQLQVLVLIR